MALRASLLWLLLLAIAVLAGGLRNALLVPRVGEQQGHVIGTLVVVAVFAATIGLAVPWIDPHLRRGNLLGVGVAWAAATGAFEFVFGRFVIGHPWRRLVADYDLAAGRLWILVLLALVVTPPLAAWIRSGPQRPRA
jgi:hypothetical protein